MATKAHQATAEKNNADAIVSETSSAVNANPSDLEILNDLLENVSELHFDFYIVIEALMSSIGDSPRYRSHFSGASSE